MSNDPVTHAIAGAGGGALAAVVTYPLITLSTRAQTAATQQNVGNIEVIKRVLKKEGISGLYAGLDSALYGMTLTNFVYYYFYEGIKAFYTVNGPITTGQSMITGACSGAATAIVTNPIWVVNTRMMVNDSESTLTTIKKIIKEEGVSTFFSGIGPALLLVINPVLNYTIYEQLKVALEKRRPVNGLDTFVLGALGKIVATSVTYPLITIKSRLQLGQEKVASKGAKKVPKDKLIQRILEVFKNIGFADLYRGWSLKVLQSALQSAFLFLFKEQLFTLAIAVIGLYKRARKLPTPPRLQARVL